jgi:hypothetical protein
MPAMLSEALSPTIPAEQKGNSMKGRGWRGLGFKENSLSSFASLTSWDRLAPRRLKVGCPMDRSAVGCSGNREF